MESQLCAPVGGSRLKCDLRFTLALTPVSISAAVSGNTHLRFSDGYRNFVNALKRTKKNVFIDEMAK